MELAGLFVGGRSAAVPRGEAPGSRPRAERRPARPLLQSFLPFRS
jgi:hypothetical protein